MNGQELMQKLLHSYERSYDITAPCQVNGHTYDAAAYFNESGAKYVLTKKAELWRISCYEDVYFRVTDHLDEAAVDEFLNDFINWIEPKVVRGGKEVPDTDHMYTLVTGIFFADQPVSKEVKRKIRRYHFYKNYRFALRGYCQVRLLVFDMAERKLIGNRAARELIKGYNKVFRP
ncbi:MAG: hypothetical protein SOT28_05850 [Fusicatenibacter sp.]|nr:hypothetical protein [Lachnospiraceae bacterium]MDY2937824.1 hypothetical protein [Fusicatenibacter sp.]